MTTYTKTLGTPANYDGTLLSHEIKDAIPSKQLNYIIRSSYTQVDVTFDTALTPGEELTLTTTVTNHDSTFIDYTILPLTLYSNTIDWNFGALTNTLVRNKFNRIINGPTSGTYNLSILIAKIQYLQSAEIIFVDESLACSHDRTITIIPTAPNLIMGSSSGIVMNAPGMSIRLYNNGTDWFIY